MMIVFILLGNVFVELAAWSILNALATAPPHLAGPLGLVRTTRPVEVVFILIVSFALITNFKIRVEPTLPTF